MKYLFFVSLTIFLLISSCTSKPGSIDRDLLPVSMGAPGEMIICMDSIQWKSPLGEKIREVFHAEVQGINRDEYLFTIRYIKPSKLSTTLRQIANLMYVTTFDVQTKDARIIQGYFTPESKEKIHSNKDFFLSTSKDVYARDQSIMYLFGQTEKDLIRNIDNNSSRLIEYFNTSERKRIQSSLLKTREKGIEQEIQDKFGLSARIPAGFQVAMNEDQFMWIRRMDNDIDKTIFITWTNYHDFEQFEQFRIIDFRDRTCYKYLYGDKENDPDSYVVTETDIPFKPVISKQINLNGNYTVETRGLWRTNNKTMGGPFIGLTLVDESTNRLYYIEGLVYSPGKPQREIMREMEAILYTFKVPKTDTPDK